MSISIIGVIAAVAIVGCTGCLMGFFLCFASEKFKVEVDEREDAILEVLPGNNCGGCGYAGCSGLAAAIVKGEAPVNGCPVGGAPVGAKIGEIMGVEAEETVRKVAFVKCAGTCEKAKKDYEYAGVEDCRAMAYVRAADRRPAVTAVWDTAAAWQPAPLTRSTLWTASRRWIRKPARPVESAWRPARGI